MGRAASNAGRGASKLASKLPKGFAKKWAAGLKRAASLRKAWRAGQAKAKAFWKAWRAGQAKAKAFWKAWRAGQAKAKAFWKAWRAGQAKAKAFQQAWARGLAKTKALQRALGRGGKSAGNGGSKSQKLPKKGGQQRPEPRSAAQQAKLAKARDRVEQAMDAAEAVQSGVDAIQSAIQGNVPQAIGDVGSGLAGLGRGSAQLPAPIKRSDYNYHSAKDEDSLRRAGVLPERRTLDDAKQRQLDRDHIQNKNPPERARDMPLPTDPPKGWPRWRKALFHFLRAVKGVENLDN